MAARRERPVDEVRVDRLLVTVGLGATLPFGEMGFLKPELRVANIDPAGDVAAQVQAGLAAAGVAFAAIDGELERVISDMLTPMGSKPGYADRVERLERSVDMIRRNIATVVTKVREHEAAIAARAALVVAGEADVGEASE